MSTQPAIVLRSSYALCLLAGAATHVWTLITHGIFWDYGGALVFTQVYWTSLTLFDPLGAALLLLKPRAGLLLTLAIIVSDVAHNTWLMQRNPAPHWLNWMYVAQVLFFVFVLMTFASAWRGTQVISEPQSR